MIPEAARGYIPGQPIWVVYDLRDPDQWERTRDDRDTWGRGLSEVHSLDLDHVVIVFYPGGAGSRAAA
jgi:hypothetical protein